VRGPQQHETPADEAAAQTYAEGLDDPVEYYEDALVEQQTEAEQLRQQLALRVVSLLPWSRPLIRAKESIKARMRQHWPGLGAIWR
jgi:hypothetical protein